MFERVPFKREHLAHMFVQESNASARAFFENINYDVLEKMQSFTGMLNGYPAVCGGVAPCWQGRGSIWAVFDENTKRSFLPVFRGLKSFLNDALLVYNRLEMSVPCDLKNELRRAKLLGFSVECERAVHFLPDGKDCTLFVLLRIA